MGGRPAVQGGCGVHNNHILLQPVRQDFRDDCRLRSNGGVARPQTPRETLEGRDCKVVRKSALGSELSLQKPYCKSCRQESGISARGVCRRADFTLKTRQRIFFERV